MLIRINVSKPRAKGHFNADAGTENMTVTYWPELVLFVQSIEESAGTFTVTYSPPNELDKKSVDIPLEPDIIALEPIDTVLHGSPTKAYKMYETVNQWFTDCLGQEVMLVYLGSNRRPVLGNLSPNAGSTAKSGAQSWLTTLTSSIPNIVQTKSINEDGLTYADLAAYLVVTEESLQDVSSRLPDNEDMDVTKFRPNIVLSGASQAWEEDFWGAITIRDPSMRESGGKAKSELILTNNCARCVSINIDYNTGQPGLGESGNILKKLMKDRRVDQGSKYSPIFGRYGFLKGDDAANAHVIAVGDAVTLSRRNTERTKFGKASSTNMMSLELKRTEQNGPACRLEDENERIHGTTVNTTTTHHHHLLFCLRQISLAHSNLEIVVTNLPRSRCPTRLECLLHHRHSVHRLVHVQRHGQRGQETHHDC